MNDLSKITLAISLCFLSQANGAEIQLRTAMGYDSNALRLADQHEVEAQFYFYNSARFKTDYRSPFIFDVGVYDWQFVDDDRADSSMTNVTLGYRGKELSDDLRYTLRFNRRDYDKTYVSRFSGEVYELKGVELADRYDHSRDTFSLSLDYKLSKSDKLGYEGYFRQADYQSYEEYEELGLTELDYDEFYNRLFWETRLSKATRVRLGGEYKFRDYQEKLAKSLDGNNIESRELEYQYLGLTAYVRHYFSKQWRVTLDGKWQSKGDNGGGYYDTEYKMLKGAVRYKSNEDHIWTLSATFHDLSYDRQTENRNNEDDLAANDEFPDTRGTLFKLVYQVPLWTTDSFDTEFYANGSYYNYRSSTPEFQYDRSKIEAGIKFNFNW